MERLTHRRESDGAVCPNCTQTDIETRWGEVVQEMADKLCDYEDAEEHGLLVRLPCKPREVVWVYYPKYKEIERIAYMTRSEILEDIELGAVICKTREEAEAVLKGEDADV